MGNWSRMESAAGSAFNVSAKDRRLALNPSLPGRGHRDTHFKFLRQLSRDDMLEVQAPDGSWFNYQVNQMSIVGTGQAADFLPDDNQLYMITCYPFDAISPGGPLLCVVAANLTDKLMP